MKIILNKIINKNFTKKNKIILCPMEELSVVKKYSFEVVKVDIENIIDKALAIRPSLPDYKSIVI